ncbi:hypothetical protein MTR67_043424 [Solanum verrucosum]|uniref:Uncharacterized protein n=1 Tax=Solanum verrucosum TaxID=315347 RepID=A0AAF0URP8_SOLVR|nr:hypothetical protein MTR67_043424 [Solanum verrucosum]
MASFEALHGRRCRSPVGWSDAFETGRLGTKFIEGEQVLMKVSPMKGVMRFGKRGKFRPRSAPVFHVSMLEKYHGDGNYIIRWDSVLLDENLSYEEDPVAILDRRSAS